MTDPAAELVSWFQAMPRNLQRELAGKLRRRVDSARDRLEAAAPAGETGKLKSTVRVRRKRHDLDLEITAGGPETTKEVRKGSSAEYDYAMATEFGNEHVAAKPWFYKTWHGGLRAETLEGIEADVAEVLGKV